MTDEKDVDLLRNKAKVFFEKGVMVHVSNSAKSFWNGTIVELSHEFFVMEERKFGRILLFFNQIKDIEFFNERIK